MFQVLESDKTLAHKFKKSVKGLHSAASGIIMLYVTLMFLLQVFHGNHKQLRKSKPDL